MSTILQITKRHRNRLNKFIKKAKEDYASSLLVDCNSNKDQWQVINNLIKPGVGKSTRIDNITVNDMEISKSTEIAEYFNDFFVSIGPKLAEATSSSPPSETNVIPEPSFSLFLYPTNAEEIDRIIN